jgi:hypothetical protein
VRDFLDLYVLAFVFFGWLFGDGSSLVGIERCRLELRGAVPVEVVLGVV